MVQAAINMWLDYGRGIDRQRVFVSAVVLCVVTGAAYTRILLKRTGVDSAQAEG